MYNERVILSAVYYMHTWMYVRRLVCLCFQGAPAKKYKEIHILCYGRSLRLSDAKALISHKNTLFAVTDISRRERKQ